GALEAENFGADGARMGEQKALSETNVDFQQIDDDGFAFDPVGDELDAVAAHQVGQIGRMNMSGRRDLLAQHQLRRNLDEAHAALREAARIDAKILDPVERKTKAALGERREAV